MGILDGRAVVVTGSGRGLGQAYAIAAAREGAAVVVNDIDGDVAAAAAAELRAAGRRAVASDRSVADPDQAAEIIDQCVAEFGRIDGLVNNAGLIATGAPWEQDAATAHRLVGVNLLGVIHCGTAAIERFRTQGGPGVIVNVSSGSMVGMPGLSVYGATKGAVASLIYGWAVDLADLDIRVIGYSPLAGTRMANNATGLPDPHRVALAMPYLLSDGAAGLSGQVVRFDGTRLSLLHLPVFSGPFETSDEWTVAGVAEALGGPLRRSVQPVGMARRDLSVRP